MREGGLTDDTRPAPPPPRRGLAVAALVLALLALVTLGATGLIAVPLAIVALWRGQSGILAVIALLLGILGSLVFVVVVAILLFLWNFAQTRQHADSVATWLTTVVAPSQTAWRDGRGADADGDGIGEFADLDQLLRPTVAGGPVLPLAGTPWPTDIDRDAYRLTLWLPDGKGGAVTSAAAIDQAAIDGREAHWLLLAMPVPETIGASALVIGPDGLVRERILNRFSDMDNHLRWEDIMPDGWDGDIAPVWHHHRPFTRRRHGGGGHHSFDWD